jgi:AraC-like DNA-binding protein
VAKALALSLRTLARRLADEGTPYGEVVDQLRSSLAIQYLKEPVMSLGQIAWLLGYEGSTSSNHAFKRWTGARLRMIGTDNGFISSSEARGRLGVKRQKIGKL